MTKPKTTGKIKPHGTGKKKIEIKKIENKAYRMTTFSKRRKGLFKKADEFRAKTGSKVAIVVMSPAGRPYPFGDIEFVKNALISDPNFPKNFNINPPEEKQEEDGKPDWYGDMNVSDSALKYDLNLPINNRINPPEEKLEECGSRFGASTGGRKVDMNVSDSALKFDLNLPLNNRIHPPEEKIEECGSRSGARTGGRKVDLKQWLNDLDLDKCDNLEGLCSLQKQLEEIEKMVLTKELSTWKLSL